VVRVSISDGAHTATVVSPPFSVPKKLPVAEILDPGPGETFHLGDQVTLEGAAFDYEDGTLSGTSLAWSVVGSGTIGTGEELAIDVDQAGAFTLSLTVTDADGNVATDSVDVDVLPTPDVEQSSGRPPVADAGGAYSAVEGTPALVSGAASFDPDGGSLLFGWDFGGGSTATGERTTHIYADDGVYTADLVVIDPELLTDTAAATVSVQNQPPLVDVPWSWTADPTVPVQLQASFEDPGALDAPWTVTWDFGDASSPTSYQTGSQGMVAQSHAYATDGVYFATLTVQDKDGGSSTVETVVYVPEPARVLAWVVGAIALRWLARRRRRE
jgi:PKD repeat protein